MQIGEYEIKEGLKYTKEHDWIEIIDEKMIIGISDYAVKELGGIAFIDLPEPDKMIKQGDIICELEAVKTTSEINSPVNGKIVDVNDELEDSPELLDDDPYGAWIIKIKFDEEPIDLLTAEEYRSLLESLIEE